MKRVFFTVAALMLLICALSITAQAKDVYLEPIPDELKVENDTATHFIVFEEEKYFSGSGSTVYGLNSAKIAADMFSAKIDTGKIGTEYLTRFNFPAKLGSNTVTYVNLNAIKANTYFKDVCGYVQLAGTVSQVNDMSQSIAQLRCIDFGEDSRVTSIPTMFAANANKLMSVKNLPSSLTVVGKQAFNNCYGAFRGELYLNATSIEESAFNNAVSNVTHLVFGPNVRSIGKQAFSVRTIEFSPFFAPSGRTVAIKSIEFLCDVSKVAFYQQGADTGAFYFSLNTARTPYSKLTCIILSHPDNAALVKEGSVFNDFMPSNVTVLFNDEDGADDFVYASHTYGAPRISYDSYLENGSRISSCTACGAQTAQSVAPLFECLGYSTAEKGSGSIMLGFIVNLELLKEYEASTGKEISYGVYAVSKERLGQNTVFNSSGKAADGVVYKDLSDNIFSCIGIKVTGIDVSEHKDVKLAMGVYATKHEGASKGINYLQAAKPQNGELYSFISYSEIKE